MLSSEVMPPSAYLATAIGFVIASSFRYSFGPFLAISVALLVWKCWSRINFRWLTMAALIIMLGMTPSFVYNYVRMGSPLRPATTAPQYAHDQGLSLHGNIPRGLYVLILSPNRGLLEFSPICLVLITLPWVWRRMPRVCQQMTLIFGVGAVLYTVMIADIRNSGTFGWGPRYLVPTLPIIFLPVASIIQILWDRWHVLLLFLLVISASLNGMAVLVNWHLASTEDHRVLEQTAMLPYQQMAVWRGFGLALRGKPLPMPPEVSEDDIRKGGARFPDLWEVRLMERSRAGMLAGISSLLCLLLVFLGLLFPLLRHNDSHQSLAPMAERSH
jgi:hypothetical protein